MYAFGMPMDQVNLIGQLRKRIAQMESERRFDNKAYPEGLVRFPGVLPGQGFFPGGDGLWRDDPNSAAMHELTTGGIMVLGNDFGCLDSEDARSPGFNQCLPRGYENPPTWTFFKELYGKSVPKNECFFTNAYLGLRRCSKSTDPCPKKVKITGLSPGLKDEKFLPFCQEFFECQLSILRPRVIICLGHEPRKFLAQFLAPSRESTTPLLDKMRPWKNNSISFNRLDKVCAPILDCSALLCDKFTHDFKATVIAHTSFAWSTHNKHPRTYKDKDGKVKYGKDAEVAILKEALSR